MLISSMGRYAVLILLDLAEHRGGFVPVRQIAERQELSQKYLFLQSECNRFHGIVDGFKTDQLKVAQGRTLSPQ